MSNDRPISVHKMIPANGSYQILTPNCLLLGRATNKPAQDDDNEDFGKKSERLQLVADVTQHFWKRWAAEVTPIEVVRQRWHETGRNLRVGDLVLVHEASKVKNKYILARVEMVKESKDGLVLSCSVGYSVTKATKDSRKYRGRGNS